MKKTTKRFLALLLAFTMVLGMGMQTFASGTDAVNSGQSQTTQAEQTDVVQSNNEEVA